jgi:4-hydroxythreonine-4-phosphate dehydrogenase
MIPAREIVVSTGDPQGVGPEVSLRAAATILEQVPEARIVLAGDPDLLQRLADRELRPCEGDMASQDPLSLLPVPLPRALDEGPPSAAGGAAALSSLEAAVERVCGGRGRALVTAPVSKAAVAATGISFTGHTGWLADRLGSERVVMMFVAESLRVALATVHLPLRAVPAALSAEGLVQTLRILDVWLKDRLGLDRPRIAVLGLNPHAGEDGLLGSEERELIVPAIDAHNRQGGAACGPFGADSFFNSAASADTDAVLAMYHDQGLLPVKALAFGRAVNVTLGLPLVRTSVDHGCAFSIAGRGKADPGSMVAAMRLALELVGEASH